MKYCPKCNSLGDENDTVCAECGSKLEELTLESSILDKKTDSKISIEPIEEVSKEKKNQLNKVEESKEEKKVKSKELELKIIILLLAIILLIVILYLIFSSK